MMLSGRLVFVRVWNVSRVGERVEGRVITAERVRAHRWTMRVEIVRVERAIVGSSCRL